MKYIFAILFLLLPATFLSAQPRRPLKMENLTYQDRSRWRAILKWPNECEELFNNEGKKPGLTFWGLEGKKYLIEVECAVTYQGVQSYFFYDELAASAKPVKLMIYRQDKTGRVSSQEETIIAGFPEFDIQKKILTVWTKFRGDSDCGALATYLISPLGTADLRMFRAKFSCDGKESLPENYPLVYPSGPVKSNETRTSPVTDKKENKTKKAIKKIWNKIKKPVQ